MGFEVAAGDYDRFMGAWSRLLSAPFLDFAGVGRGQQALDVGCGPGVLTEELVQRLGAGAVKAVDPSASFVEAVRERLPEVEVRQATAEQLPFDTGSFDATLAQLVVHFMDDPVAGLSEMARVTRAGGVVAASVWDFSGGRDPLGPFWGVVRELDSGIQGESLLWGTGRGDLTKLMSEAGLEAIEERDIVVERWFSDFDAWWRPFTAGVGRAGAYVQDLDGEARQSLRDACRSRLPKGAFRLEAAAWAARGTAG